MRDARNQQVVAKRHDREKVKTIVRTVTLNLALVFFVVARAAAQIGPEPPTSITDNTRPGIRAAADDSRTGEKAVEQGPFPKSIKIPGTDLSLAIGGYVKLDFIQDFSAIGDQFEFKTTTIPARGTAAAAQSGLTTIHARESRVNFDLR